MRAITVIGPVGLAVAVAASLACSGYDARHDHPRDALFPPLPAAAWSQAFPADASLHVLYWPAGGCLPCDLPSMRALSELVLTHPEIAVVTVMPEGRPSPVSSVGMEWPGRVLALERKQYRQQMVLAPPPRIEVWDPQGQLLLLRSLPPNAVQAAAIGEEVLWAKALAKPAKAVGKGGRR